MQPAVNPRRWTALAVIALAQFMVIADTSPDPKPARALRGLREHADLSQEAVAHNADLTVSAYARIERGEANPTWSTVTQVARALDVSLVELAKTVEKTP